MGSNPARVSGPIVRTVLSVLDSGYLNARNEIIYSVLYAEGATPEWSGANTWAASSPIEVERAEVAA